MAGDEEDEISTMSTVRDIEVSKLGVDNYSRWKIEIEDALDAAELADVVRGIEAMPTNLSDPTKIASWKKKDSRARTIIRKTLSDVYFNHTRDCRTSKEIYDRIIDLKEPKSVNVLLQSWQEFHTYSWKEGDDVTSFWSGLVVIVSKIESAKGTVDDSLMMSKVLVCIPKEKFANFRASWDLISTVVYVDRVQNEVTQC